MAVWPSLVFTRSRLCRRARTAQLLNKTGHKFDYKVGDRVVFFIPPSQKEAQKAGTEAKHLLKYRGLAVIVESLSKNGTHYRLLYKGRNYERHVMNMRPYDSDTVPSLHGRVHDNT